MSGGAPRATLRAALLATAGALVLAAPAAAAQQPDVQHGFQLYAQNCASCHGNASRGVGSGSLENPRQGLGPSLLGVGALTADFYLRTGYMPLQRPNMQPRRSRVLFSDREIRDMVAYVASLGRGPAIPQPHPERGNLAQGLELFTEHCAGCHQVVAEGGYVTDAVAPPLEEATAVQIAEAVRIGPYVMPRYSTRAIGDRELDSIIAYVEQAKHPDDRGGWGIGHIGPVPEGLVTWFVAVVALVGTCILLGRRLAA